MPHSDRATGPGHRWRTAVRSASAAALFIVVLGVCQLPEFLASHYRFVINRSASLPNWAFLVEAGSLPRRGQAMFFLPRRSAIIDRHFGTHRHLFGKYALGLPGDLIERRGNAVFIRAPGASQARRVGTLKQMSSLGERLVPGPTGIIPPHCYYAGSAHHDGLDSRYAAIGLVCAGTIYGTARASVL